MNTQEKLSKLEEEKAALEGELETLKQATGSEEREKAEILATEKKARAQVSILSTAPLCLRCYIATGSLPTSIH